MSHFFYLGPAGPTMILLPTVSVFWLGHVAERHVHVQGFGLCLDLLGTQLDLPGYLRAEE